MEAPKVLQFHVALRGISPKIWRRIELSGSHSPADLHRVIQICFGWSDEYQHRFCIRHHYLAQWERSYNLRPFSSPIKDEMRILV